MSRDPLERLLAPRQVAFIGGRALDAVIANCEALGFDGDIWVVNPRHEQIAGRRCYPSVADLPQAPDAAFVGVGWEATIGVVRELAERGAGGAVCLAAGFAEIGDVGQPRQDELVAAAGDMAVIGPNCYGLLNYVDGVALWPDAHGGTRVEHGAALIAQSGNVSLNATMADRSLPLTHVLSIGNQAVTGFGEYLEALLDDPRVRAIGLYVEGVDDLARFESAALRALVQGVPLVALKSGRSALSARIAEHHTGSQAEPDGAYGDRFERLGIVGVDSPAALLETLKAFTVWDGGGPAIAAVAASGGDLALLTDLAEEGVLEFPAFDWARAGVLREQLGDLVTVANPLDYGTGVWGRHDELLACFATVMADDLDAVVLVIDYPRDGDVADWDATVGAFVAAHEQTGRRAAVVSTLPELLPREVRNRLLAAGVVPLQGLSEAVTALDAVASYHRHRADVPEGGLDRAGT